MKTKNNFFEIFKERMRQGLKENKEYKANFYSILFFDIALLFVFMLFFQIYSSMIGSDLNWTSFDFVVYYLTLFFGSKIKWFFSLQFLREHLIAGDLNMHLTKPLNIFLFENMRMISGVNIIFIPLALILFIISVLYGNYNHLFFAITLLLIGSIFEVIFINFIESTSFFIKDNRFLSDMGYRLIYTNEKYTPKAFEKLTNIFYFLSTSIYGYFVIEILNSRFDQFFYFLPYIILIYFCFSILTYFMWKIGLKKYEAFG